MPVFDAQELRKVSKNILLGLEASEEEAEVVSRFLVNANLEGHDSHGVIRIIQYAEDIRSGQIKPGAATEVIAQTACTALLNGNWGFGQTTAVKAMTMAIEKAYAHGLGAVGIINCNHIGRLADYTAVAVEHEMIGFALCNGPAVVAPFGGVQRMFNTGPISVAVPSERENPLILDMATSVCAEGKVRVSLHRKEKVPEGWITDSEGTPTTNPQDLYAGGAILPLGGSVGYKGFGLGMFVDIIGGILTGAGYATSAKYEGGNGTLVAALNIGSFVDPSRFRRDTGELVRKVKGSQLAPGFKEILVPGEIEWREKKNRGEKGIFVGDSMWQKIISLAGELSIENVGWKRREDCAGHETAHR